MTVRSLGYIVIEATDVAAWRKFAVDVIGLMEAPAANDGSLRLRIDERPFRIAVVPGKQDRLISSGLELPDEQTFLTTLESLRASGVPVRLGNAAEAQNRLARQIAYCADPCGNQLELYYGRTYDYAPFVSPRGVSGFVTGDMGLGHVVLPAPKFEETRKFYEQQLGFGLTDEMWLNMSPNPNDPPLGLYFLHAASRRHHSLALMGAPASSGCVHFMVEARTVDDVGLAYDRCLANGVQIDASLGRHSNDMMFSFYVKTPAGFSLEFGCDGLQPDWETWVPTHSLIPSTWGHKWMPPG